MTMIHMIEVKSRYDPTPVFVDGLIRVKRDDGKWYDQKLYCGPLSRFERIIARMKRMGKEVTFVYSYGLGLGLNEEDM